MKAELLTAADAVRHLFFPRRCAVCDALVAGLSQKAPLCNTCREKWRAELCSRCPVCGLVAMQCRCAPHTVCGEPTGARPRFYHLLPYTAGKRDTAAAMLLLRLKDRRDTDAVRFLAEQLTPLCMCAVAENTPPGNTGSWVITYAPRSRENTRKTGTDPAYFLAKALSHMTGIPFGKYLARVPGRNTVQKALDKTGRRENAKQSYRVANNKSLNGTAVIIIDDILTTGATMETSADLLLSAGAAVCVCMTVAKTEYTKKKE